MCLPVKPFKVEREWEHAGLLCGVVLTREGGHRCGYVRVPPAHPMHGKSYDDVPVEVHGGLTFGRIEPCAHDDGIGFWFGFDCAHAFDASYEPVFQESWTEDTKSLWRTINGVSPLPRDYEHYWTQPEVEQETERLAEQLAVITEEAS